MSIVDGLNAYSRFDYPKDYKGPAVGRVMVARRTRAHFREVAEIISNIEDDETKAELYIEFKSLFRASNRNFDPQRFMVACYPELKNYPDGA